VAMRAIVAGDLTAAEAERRHGVSASAAAAKQSDRFIESGKARLESGCRAGRCGRVDDRTPVTGGDRQSAMAPAGTRGNCGPHA
jgi:hypothetical protein